MSGIPKKRAKILALVETDPDTMMAVMDGHGEGDLDHKLMRLTVGIGQLAALLNDAGWTKAHLRKIFGFTTGWLVALGTKRTTDDVLNRISAERDRQQELVISGKLHFNCSYYRVAPKRKLRVLVEELGEVAQECDLLEQSNAGKRPIHSPALIQDELTQVAAVAVAWLEALEAPGGAATIPKGAS
ncbi:MAG: hypothetical protein P4N60_19330 [Verrucomicrobiae bacterium]|nr:hypothetical protein [Verrucomicrobiae bacterium]